MYSSFTSRCVPSLLAALLRFSKLGIGPRVDPRPVAMTELMDHYRQPINMIHRQPINMIQRLNARSEGARKMCSDSSYDKTWSPKIAD